MKNKTAPPDPSSGCTPGPRNVYFLILPDVHALDLAGPLQVLAEANQFGGDYRLRYCGTTPQVRSAQGLWISNLESLPELTAGDWVVVPGIESNSLDQMDHVPREWLRGAKKTGARLCSICSGAFILARAGLLDHQPCTTHWKVADRLQREYPAARVLKNRLFVREGNLATSAGVTSGIDLALALVEEDHGPWVVSRVARELVVYLRRGGESSQQSIYLSYRTHIHPGIHRVQDYLVGHPDRKPTIEELARLAGMSSRNLTRVFKQATGITLKTFEQELKLEIAGNLFRDPEKTVKRVASECGFKDSRQLRRLWKSRFGSNPSTWKTEEERRPSL